MFEIKFNSAGKKISYKSSSLKVKYVVGDKKLSQKLRELEKETNIKISDLGKKNFLSEKGSELRITNTGGKPDEILFVKVKTGKSFSVDYFRNHMAGLIQKLDGEALQNLYIEIPIFDLFTKYFNDEEYYYQGFAEGLALGNYSFDKYKLKKEKSHSLNVHFIAGNDRKLKAALVKASCVIEGFNFTKELQNEPSIVLTPAELALRVSSKLKKAGVKVTIFNEKEIKKRKMGGLLAVGMGSTNPPRFIVLEYNGIKGKTNKSKFISLVGKGVTFDAGGISIKPAAGMGEMKADMSGAAVVAGTVLAAAKAKLSVKLLGVIPAAENMVDGGSMRPGDVVITSSGKSIEVDNTDAEGRMILADALHYASKQKPDAIIDLATLTGACVVALGEFVAGLFTKDDQLANKLYTSGLKTYDRLWRLPMWDDYNELIKSDVADVHNTGKGRWGGAITAAKFLEHFVDEKISWAHLDIAGPAMANGHNNYSQKYMTGFGVRLLFDYLSE